MIPSQGLHYNIYIIDLSYLYRQHGSAWSSLLANRDVQREFNIRQEDYEPIFDWCVREALNRVFALPAGTRVDGHYRHDVYRCVYDHVGQEFELHLRHAVSINHIRIVPSHLKVLVAGSNLIVAQGVPPNARL
jgi:hypothetical protein